MEAYPNGSLSQWKPILMEAYPNGSLSQSKPIPIEDDKLKLSEAYPNRSVAFQWIAIYWTLSTSQ